MEGQMSIFDYLGEFANLPEEKMVEILSQRLGIKFTLEVLPPKTWKYKLDYEYKHKGLKLEVGYRTSLYDHKMFISAGYSKNTSGGGRPCDTIDEAVWYFERILEEYDGRRQNNITRRKGTGREARCLQEKAQ